MKDDDEVKMGIGRVWTALFKHLNFRNLGIFLLCSFMLYPLALHYQSMIIIPIPNVTIQSMRYMAFRHETQPQIHHTTSTRIHDAKPSLSLNLNYTAL